MFVYENVVVIIFSLPVVFNLNNHNLFLWHCKHSDFHWLEIGLGWQWRALSNPERLYCNISMMFVGIQSGCLLNKLAHGFLLSKEIVRSSCVSLIIALLPIYVLRCFLGRFSNNAQLQLVLESCPRQVSKLLEDPVCSLAWGKIPGVLIARVLNFALILVLQVDSLSWTAMNARPHPNQNKHD